MATIQQQAPAAPVVVALVLAALDQTEQVAPELQILVVVVVELKIQQHQHTAKAGLEL
jgi:hypothetical protein